MFSIYLVKSHFQQLLEPLASRLIRAQVTPNQITLASLILSCFFGGYFAFYTQLIPWIGVVFLVRMALNALDGMVARRSNAASALGCYLNELGDIISDALLYLPFGLVEKRYLYLIFLIIFLSALSETAGILGLTIGNKRRYDGPMGKSDRAFVFSLVGLGLYFQMNDLFFISIYWGMIGLLLLSIIFRVQNALRGV